MASNMYARGGMIELERVTKRFRAPARKDDAEVQPPALGDVNLSVPAGAVVGVVGPNGAGKSTLFSLILGFLRPTDGEVRVDGRVPRAYLREHGASYLPERFQLPGEWSTRASLVALGRLEGLGGAEADARTKQQLERFGLGAHADKEVRALSRGLLQRLGLAHATLVVRDLVVFDEPTEGLDPIWRIHLRNLIDELRNEGRTILLASHDLNEIERLADRAVLLERGRILQVMELHQMSAGKQRYVIELEQPSDAIVVAFPDAARSYDDDTTFEVHVRDAAELSQRLAALIEGGGILRSVRPLNEPLEQRVQRALDRTERT